MASRGGVGIGVDDFSSRLVSLILWSCCGHDLGEALLGLVEGGARIADRDDHELHFSPYGLQWCN